MSRPVRRPPRPPPRSAGSSGVLVVAITTTIATVALGLVIRGSLPSGAEERLPPGIYHGWVGPADGRFQIAGRPCAPGDAVTALELSRGANGNPRGLSGAEVASHAAAVDLGRAVTVTTFTTPALRRLVGGGQPRQRTGLASARFEFTRLKARCRSWQEVDADIGHAAVELLGERSSERAPPFEAHVIPVPDRTQILAALLLWNRSSEPVTVTAVRYAPRTVATGRVLAAAGGFEQLRAWKDRLFARTVRPPRGARPTVMKAADLDLRIAGGGIAVIAFDRGSFRPTRAATTLLSYPVVDYLVDGAPRLVGLTTPLYSTSLRGGPDFALPAVLHSLFAASSFVGPAALLDEDLFDED